ncbi:2-hydroxychromene-2-carboxylate isomerase [Nevskia soli]|uniref:2-hydroxychromene-2-carboxylate isomerase n=1 Tax=Nevskia soli TaxID=418856 RepID=UPI000690767C|nr:2-hydroxychromene-2-carboxylate isomerase [Nevskia soli]
MSDAPLESAPAEAATVDFYFDFASPYAYFAHGTLVALTRRHGLRLRYRPVLLWAILKELGMPPPMEQPAKRRYMEHDMRRSAVYFGLPFQLPPGFPVSSHAAARLFHTLDAQAPRGWSAQAGDLVAALFKAYFVDGRDIADPAVLGEAATVIGLAPQQVQQAAQAEAGKAALRQANAEAVQRGVWGSPFWFHGGEGYFGADRLAQFERSLDLARFDGGAGKV